MPSPLLLPLLLVLLSGPGSVSCSTETSDCSGENNIVHKNGTEIIPYISNRKLGVDIITVYVIPYQGFEGISLEVDNDKGKHKAWFDFDDDIPMQCFAPNNYWSELKLTVKDQVNPINNFKFKAEIGECAKTCTITGVAGGRWKVDVLAYGASRWRVTRPPNHCYAEVKDSNKGEDPDSKVDTCQKPPSTRRTTTTTPTTNTHHRREPPLPPRAPLASTKTTITTFDIADAATTTATSHPITQAISKTSPKPSLTVVKVTVTVVVVVVTAGTVLVVLLVVERIRRDGRSKLQESVELSSPREPASQTHVIVNDLYEPFTGHSDTPAGRQHGDSLHVVDNELYEPFDNYGNSKQH